LYLIVLILTNTVGFSLERDDLSELAKKLVPAAGGDNGVVLVLNNGQRVPGLLVSETDEKIVLKERNEKKLAERGERPEDVSLREMDEIWEEAKRIEDGRPD